MKYDSKENVKTYYVDDWLRVTVYRPGNQSVIRVRAKTAEDAARKAEKARGWYVCTCGSCCGKRQRVKRRVARRG